MVVSMVQALMPKDSSYCSGHIVASVCCAKDVSETRDRDLICPCLRKYDGLCVCESEQHECSHGS